MCLGHLQASSLHSAVQVGPHAPTHAQITHVRSPARPHDCAYCLCERACGCVLAGWHVRADRPKP